MFPAYRISLSLIHCTYPSAQPIRCACVLKPEFTQLAKQIFESTTAEGHRAQVQYNSPRHNWSILSSTETSNSAQKKRKCCRC
ncbi:hypothetical protein HOY82DRAFT_516790 [Tuber indicum]|nr:hypothetical protein HOY82DRAFT_516790 [Tuber indicum]